MKDNMDNQENNIDDELHESSKIVNLISSNSAEGISEYLQSLDSCNSTDGGNFLEELICIQ